MQNRIQIIKPDYGLSLQGDALSFFLVQVLFIVVAFVKPLNPTSILLILLIPLGVLLPVYLLQCYQGWGTLYLDQEGIRVRQFWGTQFYPWYKVETIYTASVSALRNSADWELWYGKARKIYIMMPGCDMGCALTSYPYAEYTIGSLLRYLTDYRDEVLATANRDSDK